MNNFVLVLYYREKIWTSWNWIVKCLKSNL
jgi:hypothetical protein